MLYFLVSSAARHPLDYSKCASVIRETAARLDVFHRSTGLPGALPQQSFWKAFTYFHPAQYTLDLLF